MENKYYTQYKGIYYRYREVNGPSCSGVWDLSESEDDMYGNRVSYNADLFRIDECFEKFFKKIK